LKREKIKKPLAKLTKRRKEKTQINKIREDNVDITIDHNEIQKITRCYFENLYSSKLEKEEEIDKFLNT
jgi:predicted O-linked N-acetylglucosamine transferase (SPINDLY family)